MQCPYCKKENPEHPEICALCGYDPTVPYKPPTSEATRAAWLSFILAILSFFTLLITAIPTIIYACIALKQIRSSTDRLKGRGLARASIVISLFTSVVVPAVLCYLWSLDAPPIPNDYTIADLRSAPANCAESYRLLQDICTAEPYAKRGEAIGLSQDDVTIINSLSKTEFDPEDHEAAKALRENEKDLELAWNKTREARNVVAKLAGFAEIADLSDLELESNLAPTNLLVMARLNRVYLYLQIDRGESQLCIKELVELDSVIRKLAVNARDFFTKLICFQCISENMDTANAIANKPETSQESIRLITEHFVPLTDEAMSLRNPIVNEYLRLKYYISKELAKAGFVKSLTLKRNSTLRLNRNYYDNLLAIEGGAKSKRTPDLAAWPSAYRGFEAVSFRRGGKLPFIYRCYNPTGSARIGMAGLRFGRHFTDITRRRVRDDLLQIVLNKRLGKPVSLKARAFGDKYIVDVEGKKIFSPGPDGKAGTKDDIKLPINPAVLGWDGGVDNE